MSRFGCLVWATSFAASGVCFSCKPNLVIGSLRSEEDRSVPTMILPTPNAPATLPDAAPPLDTPSGPSILPLDAGMTPVSPPAAVLPMPDAAAPPVVPTPDAATGDDAGDLVFTTGFEDGFTAYDDGGGGCFASPSSAYDVATAPVRSGQQSAQFQAGADGTEDGYMAHCFRSLELPLDAFYGAWFYVPAQVTSAYVWAVMHFDTEGPDIQHELWDVRLEPTPEGSLTVSVFDYVRMQALQPETPTAIPVGSWFHLEVHWVQATDDSGAFELYVDGQRVVGVNGETVDDSGSNEWYVGNFAAVTNPRPNTVYVDDVTIALTRQGGI